MRLNFIEKLKAQSETSKLTDVTLVERGGSVQAVPFDDVEAAGNSIKALIGLCEVPASKDVSFVVTNGTKTSETSDLNFTLNPGDQVMVVRQQWGA